MCHCGANAYMAMLVEACTDTTAVPLRSHTMCCNAALQLTFASNSLLHLLLLFKLCAHLDHVWKAARRRQRSVCPRQWCQYLCSDKLSMRNVAKQSEALELAAGRAR